MTNFLSIMTNKMNSKKQEEILKGKRLLDPPKKAYTSGVGKFISPSVRKEAQKSASSAFAMPSSANSSSSAGPPPVKKKKSSGTNFTNFDAW